MGLAGSPSIGPGGVAGRFGAAAIPGAIPDVPDIIAGAAPVVGAAAGCMAGVLGAVVIIAGAEAAEPAVDIAPRGCALVDAGVAPACVPVALDAGVTPVLLSVVLVPAAAFCSLAPDPSSLPQALVAPSTQASRTGQTLTRWRPSYGARRTAACADKSKTWGF